MRFPYVILILLSLSTACASVNVTRIGSPLAPKASTCELDVFRNKSEIERDFRIVCSIEAATGTSLYERKSATVAIEQAKPHACACGADAILIDSADYEGPTMTSMWGRGRAIVKAIVYSEKAH